MRTGIWMTSIAALLLMAISGCEPATDKKVKVDDHDEHEHKEPYHPGHSEFGLVYHVEGVEPAVAAKYSGDVGTITIVNQAKKEEDYKAIPIAAGEVTVIPPRGSKSNSTFAVPAKNKDADGKASVFELEDKKLATVMSGNYSVEVEVDGKKHKYEVFEHGH